MKCYIASPFFNASEISVVETLEDVIIKTGNKYYSPMRHGILKDMPKEEIAIESKRIFDENVEMINWADLIVANTDNFDAGTMIEIGMAHALNKTIITYSEQGYGANVMIAEASSGHYTDLFQLELAIDREIFNGKQEVVE